MIEWGTYPEEMEMAAFCRGAQVVVEKGKVRINLNRLPLDPELRTAYLMRCQNDGCTDCRITSIKKGYRCTGLNWEGQATVTETKFMPMCGNLLGVMRQDQTPCIYARSVTRFPVIEGKFRNARSAKIQGWE